ncbi:MAG: hypothetical protein JSR92_03410 [Proteobacteria bacterium]|nr:hypothetical protein [Pseudomonadota bacterium]
MRKPCKNGHENPQRNANGDCVQCVRDRAKKWNKSEKGKAKRREIAHGREQREKKATWQRKRLGMPEPSRPPPDECEACGRKAGRKILSLDHCHVTGQFRGWLCIQCNTAIGMAGDNEAGLQRLINYLRKSIAFTGQ